MFECIFTTNKAKNLDKPTEIIKYQLNPVPDSSTHDKTNRFSKETSSDKNVTNNTTLTRTNKENDQKKRIDSG